MKRSRRILGLLGFALLAVATGAAADSPDLYPKETEASRAPASLIRTPLSVSVVSGEEIRLGRPATDLDEALDLVPGVFAQSSGNHAQDARISIRGFGARASFGVRGVRVLVDGVPTTLPDGQSEVDSIDLDFVERIDVLRGPISSLYGGGSGGVLSFTTRPPTEESRVSLSYRVGADGLTRYSGTTTGTLAGTGYVFGLASRRASGFRQHSRTRQTVLLSKLQRELSDGTQLQAQVSAVWAPEAQDPGGLNAAEVAADRSRARASARSFDTGEKLNQQRVAVSVRRPLGAGRQLELRGYRVWRDFSNTLPFENGASGTGGRVDFDRTVTGGSLVFRDHAGLLRWLGGVDVDIQQDRRRRYRNENGSRGALRFRQSETVRSIGPFAQATLEFDWGLGLVAGLRYDWTEFDVGDRFADDGDQSASFRFRELSPRLGAHFGRSDRLQVYANISTSFQVPTTVELRPLSGGGLDTGIDAEHALSLEIGAKGVLGERLFFDVALFDIRLSDTLIPFEAPGGETFVRNAGEVRRRGVELAMSALLRPGVSIRAGYTFAHYRYRDFDPVVNAAIQELDGNREPGTPEHSIGAELRLRHPGGLFAVIALRHFSDIELDDANLAESSGATISDVRIGYEATSGSIELRPFLGIRNWTGAEYNGSLRPNATFGRYFEPASNVQAYAGVDIRF